MNSPRTFAFGSFLLIPERQQLRNVDTPVRIGCRALDLLTALVERPGELVTKAELMERGWPSTIVEEANLKVNMSALRRALGDDVDTPSYIATVPGRGYRFVASVQTNHCPPPARKMTGDSVWLVDLSTLKDPTLVATAIATAIGVTPHPHNALKTLGEYLRDREVLILLDNCEHVIDAAAACASQIAAQAVGVRILVTRTA